MPVVNLTRAILRSAELGFLGVMVRTWMQTPLLCGQFFKAGDLLFFLLVLLPNLISCAIVGILLFFSFFYLAILRYFFYSDVSIVAESRAGGY